METINEKHFTHYFNKRTKTDAQYLNLPTEISFNTCLNDCILFCIKRKEVERIRETRVFLDFYKFLKDDDILIRINESEYYNLLEKISKAINKSITYEELEVYLKKIKFLFSRRYYNFLVEELKINIKKTDPNFELIEKYTMNFINEIIQYRVSYPYLSFAFNDYYKEKKHINIYEFIDYLAYEENENIEMYLPLKNYSTRDIAFLNSQGQQTEVREIDGKKITYCKIFANQIDFFSICSDNMLRIESFFNLFKFYRDSQIAFDYEGTVYIERNKILKDSNEITFSNLISFKYFIGKKEIVENVIENMNKLKDSNNSLFYVLNNVLSYAEKDNDLLTVGSFVDNWIALETLIKLSGFKNGFDGVTTYIPPTLSIQYYRKIINETLKKCRKSRTMDNFFDLIFNEKNDFLNDYKFSDKTFIKNESDTILSYKKLKTRIDEISYYLERDLYRIYNLRNEYVHSSNLTASIGVQAFKLKRLFSDFFDVFMKTLNAHLKDNHLSVTGVDIISDLQKKYENREIVLKLYCGQLKINGESINRKNIFNSLSDKQIISNIFFDRILILNSSNQ